jgi:hypothetical protein
MVFAEARVGAERSGSPRRRAASENVRRSDRSRSCTSAAGRRRISSAEPCLPSTEPGSSRPPSPASVEIMKPRRSDTYASRSPPGNHTDRTRRCAPRSRAKRCPASSPASRRRGFVRGSGPQGGRDTAPVRRNANVLVGGDLSSVPSSRPFDPARPACAGGTTRDRPAGCPTRRPTSDCPPSCAYVLDDGSGVPDDAQAIGIEFPGEERVVAGEEQVARIGVDAAESAWKSAGAPCRASPA